MNQLEVILPDALKRVRNEGSVAARPVMLQHVRTRVRRRRSAAAVAAVGMSAVVIAGGVWVTDIVERSPAPVENDAVGEFEPLPEPPGSVTAELPAFVPTGAELVLVYRDGDVYKVFSEADHSGLVECPYRRSEPRGCDGPTAMAWTAGPGEELSMRGSDDLELPEIPEGAEVLWQSVPTSGSIGINSPGACDRIERFGPHYGCVDDEPARTRIIRRELSGGAAAEVPRSWHAAEGSAPDDVVFRASTNEQPAWADAATMRAPRAEDAFVSMVYVRAPGSPEPFPDRLDVDTFGEGAAMYEGVPVRTLRGVPADDPSLQCYAGSDLRITYWIGPEASRTTWAQTRFIVENLELPRC